jgi:hypothetical protein
MGGRGGTSGGADVLGGGADVLAGGSDGVAGGSAYGDCPNRKPDWPSGAAGRTRGCADVCCLGAASSGTAGMLDEVGAGGGATGPLHGLPPGGRCGATPPVIADRWRAASSRSPSYGNGGALAGTRSPNDSWVGSVTAAASAAAERRGASGRSTCSTVRP